MVKKMIFSLVLITLLACQSQSNLNQYDKKKEGDNKLKELLNPSENETLIAALHTSVGTIELELYPGIVPKTVENFVGLADKGYYDGTIFHRVITDFMIQGGDPTGSGRGGVSYWGGKFEDEFSDTLKHNTAGILSMANSGPNSNGSQFFITLVPTPWLDGKHSVFGKVINGIEVLNSIGNVKTSKPFDKPIIDVVIEKVSVEKKSRN